MRQPQYLKCDTTDCTHWNDGNCIKEASVTIQEHRCVDYEERIVLPAATVTIEVSGGLVQNVYASPDLPEIRIELIDTYNMGEETEEAEDRRKRLLARIAQAHKHIF